MNYSKSPSHVRVDFFKESGKWYATEEIEWNGSYEGIIHDEFIRSIHSTIGLHYGEMTAVCLDPYHKYSHPLMVKNWGERARELGLS